MQMTDEEIRTWYRDAKDKEQAVTILSEMNLVTKKEIRRIIDGGEAEGGRVKFSSAERKYFRWSAELFEELKRLYAEKLPIGEIAERLGIDYNTVKSKIASESFKAFRRPKGKKEPKICPPESNGFSADKGRERDGVKGVDERYIKQLEQLLSKRTADWEEVVRKNEELSAENEKLLFRALCAEMPTASVERFEEIRSIADCIHAVDFELLNDCDSVVFLICRIMDVCDQEIRKGKSPAPLETATELSR